MKELVTTRQSLPQITDPQELAETMVALFGNMADMVKRNTEALEQISLNCKIQSDRLEALERQVRLGMKVSQTQIKYLNDRMKKRARELLSRKELGEDSKAMKDMVNAIRKEVLSRYGISHLREVPQHEYTVAMEQIDTWNDVVVTIDIVRAARRRNDHGQA